MNNIDRLQLVRNYLDNEENVAAAVDHEENRRRRRRWWVRPWLLRRPLLGQYVRLMTELSNEDAASFKHFVRISPAMFRELLARIAKKDTLFRKALDPGLKLAMTLRYLATGDSYKSLMYGFRVASNIIMRIRPVKP